MESKHFCLDIALRYEFDYKSSSMVLFLYKKERKKRVFISSAENQKGAIIIQGYSIENKKGTIAI